MKQGNVFTQTNLKVPSSNIFDLSHDKKMSLQMGKLIPVLCEETSPGDHWDIKTSQMLRMAPMIAPPMHELNVYMHGFFVPNRILWDGWKDFISGGEDGTEEPTHPYFKINANTIAIGTVADYLGLPAYAPGTAPDIEIEISSLPIAAIAMIYNEYYRDQNLIPKIPDTVGDGETTDATLLNLLRGSPPQRAWQHDYFTSCLPWTQRGPEATIPLGDTAPLSYVFPTIGSQINDVSTGLPYTQDQNVSIGQNGTISWLEGDLDGSMSIDVSQNHVADLSSASAAGIIDLRRAFKLQEWLEKNARGGGRYTEFIISQFGEHIGDATLQRPEFLGGSKSAVSFSEVLQTSGTSAEPTPQGNMAGHGINVGSGNINYHCKEHGHIIMFMSVMPKTAYSQGIHKKWTKFDKFDYYFDSFSQIGEQAVLNQELYLTDTAEDNAATFGYIPRYSEYKYLPSTVHGEFRTSLDFWHMGRIFDNAPALNAEFILCDPTTRIFAVEEDSEHLYAHVYHRIKARRKMHYFSNPKL